MGKAYVSIDGGTAVLVDLYNGATVFQQKVWSTGVLTPGDHYVTITWSGLRCSSGPIPVGCVTPCVS